MKLTAKHLRHIIREELSLFESAEDSVYRDLQRLVSTFPRPADVDLESLVAQGVGVPVPAGFVAGLPRPQPRNEKYPDGFHAGNLFTQVALALAQNGWSDEMISLGLEESGVLRRLFARIASSQKWASTADAGLAWAKHAFPKGGFVDPGTVPTPPVPAELDDETYHITISDPAYPGSVPGDKWKETATGQDGVRDLLEELWRQFDRQGGWGPDIEDSDLKVTRESDGKVVASAKKGMGITWNDGNVSWSPLP